MEEIFGLIAKGFLVALGSVFGVSAGLVVSLCFSLLLAKFLWE